MLSCTMILCLLWGLDLLALFENLPEFNQTIPHSSMRATAIYSVPYDINGRACT